MDVSDPTRAAAERAPMTVADLSEEPLYIDQENPEVCSGSKVRRPWRIEDDGAAEWALRRKAEQDQEIARIRAEADKAKRWIDQRAARLTEEAERGSKFFEAVLLEWMSRARGLLLQGRAKSKKYLFGVIGVRSAPRKLLYDNEQIALEWCRAQGVETGLYRVTFAIEKDAVKAWCERHDTTPPGARWEGGQDAPYVKAEAPSLPSLAAATPLQLVKETP